jgi:hypothetical protein
MAQHAHRAAMATGADLADFWLFSNRTPLPSPILLFFEREVLSNGSENTQI